MLTLIKSNSLRKYKFPLIFVVAYGILYVINYLLTGLMQPGGYYVEWLDNYLDYVSVFRSFLLNSTSVVISWFGYESKVDGNILWVKGGHNIRMVYSCIGINILCMWLAFCMALPVRLNKKLLYLITGMMSLIALNILRLSMLTMSPANYSFGSLALDHHTIYNWVAYGLIFLAMKRMIDIQHRVKQK